MAREIEASLLVKAKDQVSSTLRKIGRGAKRMGDQIDDGADKGREGLETLANAFGAVNQGLEIGKKGLELFRLGLELTVVKAIEQRAENDKQRKDMKAFGIQVERVAGLLGDVLIPIILGVADAFEPVLDASEAYLAENRKLMGSGLTEWLTNIAQVLVSGIATGVLLVTKAWSGWSALIDVVRSLSNSFFAEMLDGFDVLLEAAERAASFMGKEGLAASIRETRKEIKGMAEDSRDTADTLTGQAARTIAEQEALERKIDEVVATISQGIGNVSVAVHNRLNETIKKIPPNYEELKAAAEAAMEAIRKENDRALDAANARLEIIRINLEREGAIKAELREIEEAAAAEAWETEQQRMLDRVQTATDLATQFALSATDAFTDLGEVVDGKTKTMGDGFKQLFKGITAQVIELAKQFVIGQIQQTAAAVANGKTQIAVTSATAATKAADSQAGIPIIGPALAIAAATAMFAALSAFASKFAQGGIVPGTGVQDSVLAFLTPGELVVPKGEVSTYREIIRESTDNRRPPPMMPNLSFPSFTPPTSNQEVRRSFRQGVIPVLEDIEFYGFEGA